ncbi:FecR family protein [Mucilaginibacter sp. UYCu711]|uniref:FecR family protein n=1 Tax=Mucilaginibacter sp. UYCu711 TaxID=3156339 RepID=UPI003D1E969D
MTITRLHYLFKKHRLQSLTPDEYSEWQSLLSDPNLKDHVEAMIDWEWQLMPNNLEQIDAERKENMLAFILEQPQQKPIKKLLLRVSTAASILIILCAGAYFLNQKPVKITPALSHNEFIAPVQNGVTLMLANGKNIRIDQKHQGLMKVDDGTAINHTNNNLDYSTTLADAEQSAIHTLTNNSGSKFDITLADGSVAYLDVNSSVTYPVVFTGDSRNVSVSGQVYFKVKHNAKQPFNVVAKKEIIQDLGTEFNVNAYGLNDKVKTTLLEGAINIKDGEDGKAIALKIGEQAVLSGGKLIINEADLEVTTAWMQGKIVFNHESLENILAEVARIYNVQFVWTDNSLKNKKFGGAVSRTKKLATVLNFFRKTGEVDFLVEGSKVKVFKQRK